MELIIILLVATAAGLTGTAVGWFLRFIVALGKKGSMELEIKEKFLEAREEIERMVNEGEKKAEKFLKSAKEEIKIEEKKSQKTENRLIAKEELLDKRQTDIDNDIDELEKNKDAVINLKNSLEERIKLEINALEQISKLSQEDAEKTILKQVAENNSEGLQTRIQKMELASKEAYDKKAKDILVSSIERLSTSVWNDILTSTIKLPNEEFKGKIIGKEGRNIKTFERMSGVELIIDEQSNSITISTFDPIRREIAKHAIKKLIQDGRIQPSRIEEMLLKSKTEINKIIKEKGEEAAYKCGVIGLDPKVLLILGRLYFRTSYGQNVLQHSIEMSHLAGMIAEEIGVDVSVAKTAALLHDIGKAVDHEVAGSHVEIGRRILQKFEVGEEIIKAMQSHHDEYKHENAESVIVTITDSISGGRPGARKDSVEDYLKRLRELEAIANSFNGVENSYALQAGREIRIFVRPDQISDIEARKVAHDIAKKIEDDLRYPGEIKITVIRENRIIDYAR